MNINKISKIAKSMCILLSAASLVGTVSFVNKKILGNGLNPAKNYGWAEYIDMSERRSKNEK